MMPSHMWGDDNFNWDMLNEAMDYILTESKKIGLMPIMKEKYGTIRYEFVCLWSRTPDGSLTDVGIVYPGATGEHPTKKQLKAFEAIMWEAVKSHVEVADEIVSNWWNPYTGLHTFAEHMWFSSEDDI